jgi:sugar lactone lactonase YvrE
VEVLGAPPITTGIDDPATLALDGTGNLYVANTTGQNTGDVTVYAPQGVNPLRTLTGILGEPKGLVANAAGRLYVVAQDKVGCCQLAGFGAIYAPGASAPMHELKGLSGFAHSPLLDPAGNLYVGNFSVYPGWVSVYNAGKRHPSRIINKGIGLPIGLALAPNGDLVVLNGLFNHTYDVTVYPAGARSPSLTITAGLHRCTAIAVDADSNIYVANDRTARFHGSVTMYLSGQTTVAQSIEKDITFPSALAFDGSGRLYVASSPDKGASTLVVFPAGSSTPLHKYRLAQQFAALAVPR